MATSPRNAEKATGSTRDTLNAGIHSMAPLSAWLTLPPTPTSWGLEYKTHNVHGIPQGKLYGWRMGLSMMNMDDYNSGRHDFNMCSFVEDHMSKEDLGSDTSKQDWTDL